MILYKIRHKETGLFFKPSKYKNKRNLSKDGKWYWRKPNIKMLGKIYHHPAEPSTRWSSDDYVEKPVISQEWELVEYEAVQKYIHTSWNGYSGIDIQ